MTDDRLASVRDSTGSMVLRVDDVTSVAIELVDHLDAELVEGDEGFSSSVAIRLDALAGRVVAHAALELIERRGDIHPQEYRAVSDLAGLRRLVERIQTADALIAASTERARTRAGAAQGLAVHPTSIRNAADSVYESRAVLADREAALADLRAQFSAETGPTPESDPVSDDRGPDPVPSNPGLRVTDRDEIRKAALIVAVSLAIGVLVLVLTGSPLALAVPGVAVCWSALLVVRQRDDAYDAQIASRNLANVSRLTDLAYGGAGLLPADEVGLSAEDAAALEQAERSLSDARRRLEFADAAWRSLVGADADVDDVESVLQAHDAQYGLSDTIVEALPAVRTADAHRRRLRAQWKLAWWVLDRSVPRIDEGLAAIDALEAEGVHEIAIPIRSNAGLSDEELARLERLASGRSADQLRDAAAMTFPVVVVADEDGEITEDRLRDATSKLPDDVRFVVVAPAD